MPAKAYQPDDGRITVAALEFLHSPEGAELRAAAAAVSSHTTVADVAALRKRFPAEALHAALALAAIQPKALPKFPGLPYVWATPEALEQSTALPVARHKASRFKTLLVSAASNRILDLCAGIGGDTLPLADVAPVTTIDLSPVRNACLRYNLEQHPASHPVNVLTGDLIELLPSLPKDAVFHIDPSRRAAGKRSPLYADLIPGPDILAKLIGHFPAGVIKLSPAVDFDSLPPGHLEIISHNGAVVQALLWVGRFTETLSPRERTATVLLKDGPAWSFTAAPALIEFLSPLNSASYMYELDGTLTRSGLAAAYIAAKGLSPLTIDGGYACSKELITDAPLTAFEMLAVTPFSEARVAAALQKLPPTPAGPVEVKTRGRLPGVETDRLQQVWSKASAQAYTVLVFRSENDVVAACARRVKPA